MAYNPTLGRWMQQDPAGYVDGVSLYQYQSGRPVDMLDSDGRQTRPSGANYIRGKGTVVAASQLENGGMVALDGKNIGSVRVYIGVSAHAATDGIMPKEIADAMQLEFTGGAGAGTDCTHARWLQFVTRSPVDLKGAPVQGDQGHPFYGSFRQQYGKWYLDANTKPYYDQGGTHNRTKTESSIFDAPDLNPDEGWSTDRIQFKSYLIYNDRPVYLVEWERRLVLKEKVWQPSEYVNVRGSVVKGFVDEWAKANELPVAERQLRDGKTEYKMIKNPVPRENR